MGSIPTPNSCPDEGCGSDNLDIIDLGVIGSCSSTHEDSFRAISEAAAFVGRAQVKGPVRQDRHMDHKVNSESSTFRPLDLKDKERPVCGKDGSNATRK